MCRQTFCSRTDSECVEQHDNGHFQRFPKPRVLLAYSGAISAIDYHTAGSATVCSGNAATFTVVATGPGLSYQWYNSGGPISGATSASYTTGVAGSYYCVVSAHTALPLHPIP